jgi:hypothetical protein
VLKTEWTIPHNLSLRGHLRHPLGTSIDVRNIVVHVDGLQESGNNLDAIFGDNFAVILFLPNSDPKTL